MRLADNQTRTDPSVASLLTGIVADLQTLVQQETALATQELREEVGSAAVSMFRVTAAGVVSALGLWLLAVGAALAIPDLLAWPRWSGFVAVGAAATLAGSAALFFGARRAGRKEKPAWQSLPN